MTDWPKNDKTLSFWELTDPVVDLVRQAYFLDPNLTAVRGGLDWKGPSLPKALAAGCLPFDVAVNAENLRYDDEEQGRDPLTVIIGIAVQLGIEQGRRVAIKDTEHDDLQIGVLEILKYLRGTT